MSKVQFNLKIDSLYEKMFNEIYEKIVESMPIGKPTKGEILELAIKEMHENYVTNSNIKELI